MPLNVASAGPRLAACLVVLAAAATVCRAASQPTPYDGWAESSSYIASFDGVRIAISVHRPSRAGVAETQPLPVIVTQDRTSPAGLAESTMRRYTDQGYVWVSQDRRGTGASFGIQSGFVNRADALDAKAVIEWAGSQSFSNGKVVALGCSNQGAWQYLVAALRPRYLVAIAPACASPMFFDDAVSMGGVPIFKTRAAPYAGECSDAPWVNPVLGYPPVEPTPVDDDRGGLLLAQASAHRNCNAPMLGQYWLGMPRDGYDAFAKYRPGLEDTAMTHWRSVKESGVAILQLGGWFDAAVAGQFEGQRVWGGRLVMGPWTHGNTRAPSTHLPEAMVDLDAEVLRWFDHFAKGAPNGAGAAGIRFYTVHAPPGHEWREVSRWPQYPRKQLCLADGQALADAAPKPDATPVEYASQPLAWFGGKYSPLGRWFEGDMADTDSKSIVHETAPLASPVEVTGTVTSSLWISTDVPDINVFAVLEDVAPDGRSNYVTDGRLRASWRKVSVPPWGQGFRTWHRGYARDLAPLVPGKPDQLVFDLFPTSYVFQAGHRIRLSLATEVGDAYQAPLHPGKEHAVLTVYRDGKHPSCIFVPEAP